MLVPPLSQRPHRLALEVDNKDVVAGNQNLTQMVVAMDARSFGVDFCRHQLGDLHQQIVAAPNQAIGRLLRSTVQPRSSLVQGLENRGSAGANGPCPIAEVIRLKGLGRKRHIVGAKSERVVQFGGTLSEAVRKREQLLLGPAPGGMFAWDAFQAFDDIRPAVALVGNQRLQHAERGRHLPPSPDELDRAEKGGSVPEARHLGQETPDFQLGMDAGLKPPESLQHRAANSDRRVRLLSRAALDVGCRSQLALEAVEQWRPPKDQARDFALTGAIIRADPGEQPADEPIVGKGIDQNAARRTVLHLSQYCRSWGLCIPQDADRQQIFSRRLALRRDVQDQDDSVIIGHQRNGIRDPDTRNTQIFGSVPAPLYQVAGQNVGRELSDGLATQEAESCPALRLENGQRTRSSNIGQV